MRALYAVDLEEEHPAATAGLATARDLLVRLGARVDLLYVDPFVPTALPSGQTEELARLLEAALLRREAEHRERLAALLAVWPPGRRGAVTVLQDRAAADAIVARAAGHDLLVVGTHGRTGPARAWLGSVAEKVVRSSPVPVLVVRPIADGTRVLMAVDVFEDAAASLVSEAAGFAARLGARLDLLHVVRPPISPDPSVLAFGAAWAVELAALGEAAQAKLTALADGLPAEVRGEARVDHGEPAAAVVERAAGALVVVGTHRRSGLERLWLGSVAERIVRRAEGPVLVLPTGSTAA